MNANQRAHAKALHVSSFLHKSQPVRPASRHKSCSQTPRRDGMLLLRSGPARVTRNGSGFATTSFEPETLSLVVAPHRTPGGTMPKMIQLLFLILCNTLSGAHAQTVAATVSVGVIPWKIAVNPITNKIYVANEDSNTLTVIDGETNSTTTISVGLQPASLAVN